MLSIEDCKKHLNSHELTDEQVENLRDALYVLVEQALDEYIGVSANINET